jgi:1-acyl-sn-glycerol-3-phosphate acyltransferase
MMRALGTLRDFAVIYSSLVVFAAICLGWTLVALPLYLLLPSGRGVVFGRVGIQRGFGLYARWLTWVRIYRLDLAALDTLREGPAVILAPNHPSVIDAVLIVTRHPNVVCIMKSALMNNVLLGAGARLAGYIRNEPPRRMVRESVEALQRGALLLLFPEGTRSTEAPVNTFIAGVGLIAKLARVPVQTLLIETDSPYLSKGWPLLRLPALPITYRVRLGARFDAPHDARTLDRSLEAYFRAELVRSLQGSWLGSRGADRRAG